MELFLKILFIIIFAISLVVFYSRFLKKQLMRNKRYTVYILLSIIPALAFIYFAEEMIESELMSFDTFIYSVVSNFIGNKRTIIMETISNFASVPMIILITLIVILVLVKRKFNAVYSTMMIINVTLATLMNILLKNIFTRQRPDINRLIEETGFSFPSGHAMVSMAFYGYLIYLILVFVNNKHKYWLASFIGVLIFLIGLSRIYLGVHYASDVIAGFFGGLSILTISCALVDVYMNIIKKDIAENKDQNK